MHIIEITRGKIFNLTSFPLKGKFESPRARKRKNKRDALNTKKLKKR
jgi:hypothetical protein